MTYSMGMFTKLSPMEMVKQALEYRYYMPSYPGQVISRSLNVDPFVIEENPHIFFVGNQEKFETDIIEGTDGQKTRIILVPKFYETQQVVLVNLRTLETKSMSFNGLM